MKLYGFMKLSVAPAKSGERKKKAKDKTRIAQNSLGIVFLEEH